MSAKPFVIAGPVPPDSPVYVERDVDVEVLRLLQQRACITLLGPRQMGKSSLLFRASWLLRERKFLSLCVDVSPAKNLNQAGWYSFLFRSLTRQLPPEAKEVAGQYASGLRDQIDFRDLLQDLLRALEEKTIVLMLDEVNTISPAVCDSFFSCIREMFNVREVEPEFKRLSAVFTGSFRPRDLIHDEANSPFNISQQIFMPYLSREGVRRLVDLLPLPSDGEKNQMADLVCDWTGGHPCLTQRLCSLLAEAPSGHAGEQLVQDAVEIMLKEDANLEHVVVRVRREPNALSLLKRLVVEGEAIPFDRIMGDLLPRLEMIGAVVAGEEGLCRVPNRLYETVLRSLLRDEERRGAQRVEEPGIPSEGLEGLLREFTSAREKLTRLEEEIKRAHTHGATLMFTDLVGFTAMTGKEGDVASLAMMVVHDDLLEPIISAHSGRVVKTFGDAVMAVFPTPEGALRAACKIQNALLESNRSRPTERALSIRIGINTGEVFEKEGDLFGHSVNLAARISGEAQGGQILVGDSTREAAGPVFVFRELGTFSLKGIDEPVVVHEVVWREADSS